MSPTYADGDVCGYSWTATNMPPSLCARVGVTASTGSDALARIAAGAWQANHRHLYVAARSEMDRRGLLKATERQHTPGPYIRDGLFILTQRIENTTGIGELVAKLPEFEARKFVGESEADYKARFRRFSATGDLLASAPDLLSALAGCADALREAGKDFARANPYAARPNLYELHEQVARAAIAKATGGNAS